MGNIENFEWYETLKLAMEILFTANIKEDSWSFGGGSSIEFFFNHRKSKDVDIFLNDIQLVTYVTPRLNGIAEKYAQDYIEQSNFVKIYLKDKELDFIAVPRLTDLSPYEFKSNMFFYIEHPIETVIKKLFYRCDSLKIRDFFDLYVVGQKYKEIWEYIKKIIPESKIELIMKRIDFIISQNEETFKNSVENLNINLAKYKFNKEKLENLGKFIKVHRLLST